MKEGHCHHVEPEAGKLSARHGDEAAHGEDQSQGVGDKDELDRLYVDDEDHDEVGDALSERDGPPVHLSDHHGEEGGH